MAGPFCSALPWRWFRFLLLYVLSVGTSIHVFVPRYRLVAVPGIALCWALVVSWIDSRALRLLFCTALVAVAACVCFTAPLFISTCTRWKYALEFVEKNASADNAPVLICSDIPEADHMRMPVGSAIEESGILPPLSYYKLSVPVTPLPRTLNEETIRAGSEFLQQASQRHQRFLAMAFVQSYATLDWLARKGRGYGLTCTSWEYSMESRCWSLYPVTRQACDAFMPSGCGQRDRN